MTPGPVPASVRVLAEGEADVEAALLKAGIPADFLSTYMDPGPSEGCGWPCGVWIEEMSDDDTMVTVTIRADGVYRLESGPAEEYHDDSGDD